MKLERSTHTGLGLRCLAFATCAALACGGGEPPGPLPDLSPTDRLGRYDFHSADLMVDWALARGMKVKGHVLCWHVTTPPLVEDLPPDQVREQLRRHIFGDSRSSFLRTMSNS